MHRSIKLSAQSAEPAPTPGTDLPGDEIITRFLSTSARYLESSAGRLVQVKPDRPVPRKETVISMADRL